jgi:hypothetical protein
LLHEKNLGITTNVTTAQSVTRLPSCSKVRHRKHSPLRGIALIALAAGVVYFVRQYIQKKKAAAQPAPDATKA